MEKGIEKTGSMTRRETLIKVAAMVIRTEEEMGSYHSDSEQLAKQAGILDVRNRNIVPNLKAQRQELILRIEKIDKLLGLLEQNPHFVQMLDLTRELM